MTRKIPKETALRWKAEYETGDSLDDIAARECARGVAISSPVVAKFIRNVGGKIRTYAETIAMKKARQTAELNND